MSVIIKGLNKFYSCRLCPFNNSDCYCNITKGRIDRDDYSCEAECPIVQLPKCHGRLIDADDIDNHIIGHVDTRSCPTIIEADRGDTE